MAAAGDVAGKMAASWGVAAKMAAASRAGSTQLRLHDVEMGAELRHRLQELPQQVCRGLRIGMKYGQPVPGVKGLPSLPVLCLAMVAIPTLAS
ncbi:unnamed protein product [Lampetra planeri]